MNNFYPINLDTKKLNVLIIGLGNVGYRKLSQIKNAKNIKIISREISQEKLSYLKENNINYEIRKYQKDDLKNIDIVFACTDNINVQIQIQKDIESLDRFILSNYCKLNEYSNFSNMSTIKKDNYAIAISTYGNDPKETKKIRKKLEEKM